MSAKRAAEGAPEVAEKKAKQAEDEEENVAEEEDIEEEENDEEGDDEEDVEGVSAQIPIVRTNCLHHLITGGRRG